MSTSPPRSFPERGGFFIIKGTQYLIIFKYASSLVCFVFVLFTSRSDEAGSYYYLDIVYKIIKINIILARGAELQFINSAVCFNKY